LEISNHEMGKFAILVRIVTRKRTYGDVCGVARALDLVGERWTLMIVRELLLGPKRFTDLRTGLPAVGPDVLSQRLRELTDANLVAKRKLPPPAAAQVYELTALGRRLEPVVVALGDFGSVLPIPPDCPMRMSFDAHLLSLRTLFSPERAGDLSARIELRLDGGPPQRASIAGGRFAIEAGGFDHPDAVIEGDPGELLGVAHGRAPLAATGLRISGDRELGERFLTLFPLPEPMIA
jgi:DNA-binding HxlR family transcriptional regulator